MVQSSQPVKKSSPALFIIVVFALYATSLYLATEKFWQGKKLFLSYGALFCLFLGIILVKYWWDRRRVRKHLR